MTCPTCATETEQHDARLHALADRLDALDKMAKRFEHLVEWATETNGKVARIEESLVPQPAPVVASAEPHPVPAKFTFPGPPPRHIGLGAPMSRDEIKAAKERISPSPRLPDDDDITCREGLEHCQNEACVASKPKTAGELFFALPAEKRAAFMDAFEAAIDRTQEAADARAATPADVAGPNDIWQSVKATASAVEKWPEWKKRSAGLAGPNDSTVSGSVAQLPNQPAESKSRAEVRDTSTGEGKPVDAGESPVAPSFQAGGQAPQLAIAPAGLEVRPQAVAPAAEGTEPPPPDGPLAPQSAPREESPAQTSGGGAGGQVYLAGPMDVPCVTCGRPAKSPCGAPSATLIDGFHRSRWDRVGRSPAEQPAPPGHWCETPTNCQHSTAEKIARAAQAAPTHLADCAIRLGTSRNCDCAKPAQVAPDGGRLSERMRRKGWVSYADEVAALESKLREAYDAIDVYVRVDEQNKRRGDLLDELGGKLAAAERERDAAIESIATVSAAQARASRERDVANALLASVQVQLQEATAKERARCEAWAKFYWGAYSEAVLAIRDGKPAP